MTYEQHRESAEKKSSAEADLEAARQLLAEAENDYRLACQKYEEILNQNKKEITPKLIMQAYEEYRQALEKRGDEESILKLEEQYEKDDRILPLDLRESIEALLGRHEIKDFSKREHFLNRGRLFSSEQEFPREAILEIIEKEINTPPPKAISGKIPWTGFHKPKM